MHSKLLYNFSVDIYTQTKQIPRMKDLNGFTVTNLGGCALRINDKILFPSATPATDQGDSISFGGNEGEIYIGNIRLEFIPPLTNPRAEVIQKFYINP